MKSIQFLTITSLAVSGPFAFARSQSDADMYAPTTSAISATTTTLPRLDSIQKIGMQAANNSNSGKNMANAAIGVTTAGVLATCWNPAGAKACKYFVAGLVASTFVRMTMSGSSGQSSDLVRGVTTHDDPYNLGQGPNPGTNNNRPGQDYEGEPDYANAIKTIEKLKKEGWKIDVPGGKITPPGGKTFSTAVVNSPASMAAAGATPSDIKAYQSAISKIPSIAAEKAKSADAGSSMFADDGAGGGAPAPAAASAVADGYTNYGVMNEGRLNQASVDRDPAQVAGMAKNYNGTPVGVSADSLFEMVVRRYQYHDKKGSFISIGGVPSGR